MHSTNTLANLRSPVKGVIMFGCSRVFCVFTRLDEPDQLYHILTTFHHEPWLRQNANAPHRPLWAGLFSCCHRAIESMRPRRIETLHYLSSVHAATIPFCLQARTALAHRRRTEINLLRARFETKTRCCHK